MSKEPNQKNNKQEESELKKENGHRFKKGLLHSFILVLLIAAGCWLYQNPVIWQKYLKQEQKDNQQEAIIAQVNQLQNQLAGLQAQVLNLPQPDMSGFEDKVAALEKQNLNVIDSKADASIVLGMLTRVDKLESRLDRLAKISDDGALILSAAMLVKQAAEEGNDFVYEAEVLNQLTQETASIKKDVSVIVEYARNGVASKEELIRRFEKILAVGQKAEEGTATTWKERLNLKVNEYIKISKTGEKEPLAKEENLLLEMQSIIEDGKLIKAVKLMESSESDDIKQNQALQEWAVDVRNMITFNQAIRNIAAYSLAEMKVNNLKNKE